MALRPQSQTFYGPYSPPHSPPYNQSTHFTDTPPPPPPKPSSHETSLRSTPLSGPPLPPPPPSQQQQQYQQKPTPNTNNYSSAPYSSAPYTSPQPPHPTPAIPPPPFSAHWLPPSLLEKSTPDLLHILHTPALLAAFAATHPSHPSSTDPLNALLTTNIQLATYLTAQESALATLRQQTAHQLATTSSLHLLWRQKQTEMDKALEPWSPKALYTRYVAGVGEQEQLVRGVEDSFLESVGGDGFGDGVAGEREAGEWVRRVREEGARAWGRREGRWRWDEGRVGGWR